MAERLRKILLNNQTASTGIFASSHFLSEDDIIFILLQTLESRMNQKVFQVQHEVAGIQFTKTCWAQVENRELKNKSLVSEQAIGCLRRRGISNRVILIGQRGGGHANIYSVFTFVINRLRNYL